MPDLYLKEMRLELEATFGKPVSISTIWRTLTAAGYTTKKVRSLMHLHKCSLTCKKIQLTCVAIDRSAEKRADFAARIGAYDPEQLIFVDKSAVDRRTAYRGEAWAIKGPAATWKAFFCWGHRYVTAPFYQYY